MGSNGDPFNWLKEINQYNKFKEQCQHFSMPAVAVTKLLKYFGHFDKIANVWITIHVFCKVKLVFLLIESGGF